MTRIKAIIFDLGDVVYHLDRAKMKQHILEDLKIDDRADSKNTLYGKYDGAITKGERSFQEEFKLLSSLLKVPSSKLVQAYIAYRSKFSKIDEEMVQLIKSLRDSYKVVAFSNTNDIHKEISAEKETFIYFDDVFLSSDHGIEKPDPSSYLYVLKKINCKPSEVIFIDNKIENVEGALSLGIQGIHFKDNNQLIKDLKKLDIKW